jgi:hypothetical protein
MSTTSPAGVVQIVLGGMQQSVIERTVPKWLDVCPLVGVDLP